MASLKVLGSGSSGNSYIIQCENETLLLELGVKFENILKVLNYEIGNVVGALCTHIHQDHSKYIPNALKYGINVYSCKEVQSIHENVIVLNKGYKAKIGGFLVEPISVEHNAECYSFLIQHDEFGKLLFVTDCNDFPYKIKGLNHILCEANWSENILIDNFVDDVDVRSRYENHLEINQTIGILKENYSAELQNVVLLHLSGQNSDAAEFEERTKLELGFNNVFVAKKGLEIELSKEEF